MGRLRIQHILILFLILIGGRLSLAQPMGLVDSISGSKIPVTETTTAYRDLNLKSKDKASQLKFDLGFKQTQFASVPNQKNQTNDMTQLNLQIKSDANLLKSEKLNIDSGFESIVVAPLTDTSGAFQLAVPEAYLQNRWNESGIYLSLGRKKNDWSLLDQKWGLGLWQPLARWDAANPIEQGLTGAFIGFRNEWMEFDFFASSVYLPDQQPEFKSEDGEVSSENRWFRAPVTQAELTYSASNIRYNIEKPTASEVINQSSRAARIRLGQDKGLFFSTSYGSKPANQFHIGIDTSGIYRANSGILYADIYPYVVTHSLRTHELGYLFQNSQLVFSFNKETYNNPSLPDNYEQTALMDSAYMGGFFEFKMDVFGIKNSKANVSYVNRNIANEDASSTIIRGDVEASTSRLHFKELYGFELQKIFILSRSNEVGMGLKYVYSPIDSGEWYQFNLRFQPEPHWYLYMNADVFGVDENSLPKSSFISTFKGNDRVTGGISYVF